MIGERNPPSTAYAPLTESAIFSKFEMLQYIADVIRAGRAQNKNAHVFF